MPTFFVESIIEQYSELIKSKFSDFSFEILQGRIRRTLKNKIASTCHNINDSIAIGKEYLTETLNKALLNIGYGYEIIEGYEIIILKKKGQFCGFMVVSQGLCSKHPDVYVKTLTCSSCTGGGSVFMGLFLFTILKNPAIRHKIGLLEVGGAYMNPVAICLNEKFGFRADTSLFGDACFNDPKNLPMKHALSMNPIQLIKIVLGEISPFPSPFCLLSKQKSDIDLLIELKNILLFFEYPFVSDEERDSSIRKKYDIYDVIVANLEYQGSNDVEKFLKDYVAFWESGIKDDEMKEFYVSIVREPETNSNHYSRSTRSSPEKKKRRKSRKRSEGKVEKRGSSKK